MDGIHGPLQEESWQESALLWTEDPNPPCTILEPLYCVPELQWLWAQHHCKRMQIIVQIRTKVPLVQAIAS